MYVRQGLALLDTPTMAVHRGRIDFLDQCLHRDPGLLARTFSHRDTYPSEMGCGDAIDAVSGTPLAGRRPSTCASSTTNSGSRNGCSIAGWTYRISFDFLRHRP